MTDVLTAERKKLMEVAIDTVRLWTEVEMKGGKNPTLDDFLAQFPLFDTKALRDVVGREMFNVKHGLPGVS